MFYALMALGGLRLGEASGRRWRDLDTEAPILWALEVATQYQDRPPQPAKDDDRGPETTPIGKCEFSHTSPHHRSSNAIANQRVLPPGCGFRPEDKS